MCGRKGGKYVSMGLHAHHYLRTHVGKVIGTGSRGKWVLEGVGRHGDMALLHGHGCEELFVQVCWDWGRRVVRGACVCVSAVECFLG